MDNQYPRYGGQGSQNQPYFGPDQWAYHLASSLDHLEDPQSQQVNYVVPTHASPNASQTAMQGSTDVDVEILPPPSTQRGGKEKKVARRGVGFTKEEDAVLCSAFLNVSKDPIIGANQTQGGYYKWLHEYYNAFKPEGSNRSQIAIQSRWGTIQKVVNKFCGFKSAIDRRNESGKNEQDRIDDAIKMFEKTESFQFLHCWKILKDEAKWNDKLLELNNNTAGKRAEGSSPATSVPVTKGGNSDNFSARPEGRDSAKLRSSKRVAESSSSSSAFEVLQRMHDNREKCQKKEDEQLVLIFSRKDEKINLQRELLEFKKQQREEHLLLRRKETDLLAKQTEAQLLTTEAGIMAIDVDKVAPHLKNYYIGVQRQIMEHRGFASSDRND